MCMVFNIYNNKIINKRFGFNIPYGIYEAFPLHDNIALNELNSLLVSCSFFAGICSG